MLTVKARMQVLLRDRLLKSEPVPDVILTISTFMLHAKGGK